MSIIANRIVTTRKPSRCFGCDLEYPAGTRMQRIVGILDSQFSVTSYCPVCREYWHRYVLPDYQNFFAGDLRCDGGDDWKAIQRERETRHRGS